MGNRIRVSTGLSLLCAAAILAVSASTADACDKEKKQKQKTLTHTNAPRAIVLAGDPHDHGDVGAHVDRLHERLDRLQHQLDELRAMLDGVSGHEHRHAHGRADWTAPRMPAMPKMPKLPKLPKIDVSELHLDADELAEWKEEMQDWKHEWQEHWQEHQQEMAEEWREYAEEWKEQAAEWKERQHEMAQHWQERAHDWQERSEGRARDLADRARDRAEQLADRARERAERAVERAQREQGRERGEGRRQRADRSERRSRSNPLERHGVVYGVTGEHGDLLYDLLAPDYVKVIVSRAGENIAIQANDQEHEHLNAGLQLLGWIDRDGIFERMGEGDQMSKKYTLGEERADRLYDMLAPNTVRVIVSRSGDDAVSIRGTKMEHKVLANFLKILNWGSEGAR